MFVSFVYNQDLDPKFRRSFKDVVSNESKFQNQYSRNTIIIITIIKKHARNNKIRFSTIFSPVLNIPQHSEHNVTGRIKGYFTRLNVLFPEIDGGTMESPDEKSSVVRVPVSGATP